MAHCSKVVQCRPGKLGFEMLLDPLLGADLPSRSRMFASEVQALKLEAIF
jgi:hypothetical protein